MEEERVFGHSPTNSSKLVKWTTKIMLIVKSFSKLQRYCFPQNGKVLNYFMEYFEDHLKYDLHLNTWIMYYYIIVHTPVQPFVNKI